MDVATWNQESWKPPNDIWHSRLPHRSRPSTIHPLILSSPLFPPLQPFLFFFTLLPSPPHCRRCALCAIKVSHTSLQHPRNVPFLIILLFPRCFYLSFSHSSLTLSLLSVSIPHLPDPCARGTARVTSQRYSYSLRPYYILRNCLRHH